MTQRTYWSEQVALVSLLSLAGVAHISSIFKAGTTWEPEYMVLTAVLFLLPILAYLLERGYIYRRRRGDAIVPQSNGTTTDRGSGASGAGGKASQEGALAHLTRTNLVANKGFFATEPEQLSLSTGDPVVVLLDGDWLYVKNTAGASGYVPRSCLNDGDQIDGVGATSPPLAAVRSRSAPYDDSFEVEMAANKSSSPVSSTRAAKPIARSTSIVDPESTKQVAKMFDRYGLDHSGEISLEEATELIHNEFQNETGEPLLQDSIGFIMGAWNVFDQDRNGTLSLEEFARFLGVIQFKAKKQRLQQTEVHSTRSRSGATADDDEVRVSENPLSARGQGGTYL